MSWESRFDSDCLARTTVLVVLACWSAPQNPAEAADWSLVGLPGESLETVAIYPGSAAILFAGGAVGGGLFRSTDGGQSWLPADTGLEMVHRVNAIAFDSAPLSAPSGRSGLLPTPPARGVPMLLGALATTGPTLFRSTDLGGGWQAAATGLPASEVAAIVCDPTDFGTAYAALNGGGVYKTTDGGGTWTDSSGGLSDEVCGTGGCVLDVAIDPSAPATLYAALPVLEDVYKSTDAGGSWSATGATLQAERLALAPLQPATLYSSASLGGLEKTEDAGEGWSDLSGQPGLPPPGSSHCALAVDPTDPDSVWVVVEDVEEAVYHSTDGGLGWAIDDAGLEGVQVRDLVYADGWLLAATDDGVYRRFDGLFFDGFESGNLSGWSAAAP